MEPHRNQVYKTQNLQNKNKSTVSNSSLQNLKVQTLSHLYTHSHHPLKLTLKLTHSLIHKANPQPSAEANSLPTVTKVVSQAIVAHCRRSQPTVLKVLSVSSQYFVVFASQIPLSLSFSNFRFWNSTVTQGFSDLFRFFFCVFFVGVLRIWFCFGNDISFYVIVRIEKKN